MVPSFNVRVKIDSAADAFSKSILACTGQGIALFSQSSLPSGSQPWGASLCSETMSRAQLLCLLHFCV